jgi:hypothetical protein
MHKIFKSSVMTFYTIVDTSKGSEHTINLTHKYKQGQLRKIGPIAQYFHSWRPFWIKLIFAFNLKDSFSMHSQSFSILIETLLNQLLGIFNPILHELFVVKTIFLFLRSV